MRTLVRAALGAALTLTAVAASAQPVTFFFSGTGSGTYGSTAFTNQSFLVTIVADLTTSTYSTAQFGTPNTPGFSGLTGGTITIAGGTLTNGVFASPLYVYDNRSNAAIGFGASNDLLNLVFPAGSAASSYNLRSSIGPLTTTQLTALSQFSNIQVSGQALTFTSVSTATFLANASPGVILGPEPASLVMFGTGLGLVGVLVRRRRA